MSVQLQDLDLLEAVRAFALQHPHPRLAAFRAAMRDWGDDWQDVTPARLPVADILERCVDDCDPLARDLLQTFARHNHRLHWERPFSSLASTTTPS